MSDSESTICATVVEVLIPGPQGPGGGVGLGGYPVAVENVEAGHVIVFDGEVWENRPPSAGDMAKAVYDTDDDGKVDAAALADAVAWTGVTDRPETFPPAAHGHAIADVGGLDDALAAKADAADLTALANGLGDLAAADQVSVTDIEATGEASSATFLRGDGSWQAVAVSGGDMLAANNLSDLDDASQARDNLGLGPLAVADAVSWADVDGVPGTFPPAAHGHAIADVSGLDDALAAKADADAIPAAPAIASVEAVRAGSSATDVLGVKNTRDAQAPVELVDADTIAIDLETGINFVVTLGANRTLASPTHQTPGRSGLLIVKQDATGGRGLAFGADWRPQGGAPAMSTSATATDIFAWYVEAEGHVHLWLAGGRKGEAASRFVAVGASGTVITSPDGVTWTTRTHGVAQTLQNIDHGASGFVAAGASGTILTSSDGATWVARTSGVGTALYNVAHGPGGFMVVGTSGTILASWDGATWTARTSGVSTALYGITHGAGGFVVTGASGTILTSPDGITWTARTAGVATHLYSVAHGAGRFVVAGQAGTLLTSPDGVTWTAQSSGGTTSLNVVAAGAGVVVVAGNSGTILTSSDGETWVGRTSGVSAHLRAAAYGEDGFIVTGDGGTVLASADGVTWTARTSGVSAALNGATAAA